MGASRRVTLGVSAVAVSALAFAGGCADDDDASLSLAGEMADEMLVTIVGECVEFSVPEHHSSACVAAVGGNVMGPPDAQWFTGFAPAETDLIESGDVAQDRFLEFEGLKVFAVEYEAGTEIAARDSEGRTLHVYSTGDE